MAQMHDDLPETSWTPGSSPLGIGHPIVKERRFIQPPHLRASLVPAFSRGVGQREYQGGRQGKPVGSVAETRGLPDRNVNIAQYPADRLAQYLEAVLWA